MQNTLMNQTALIQIKGIRDGLLVSIGEAAWDVARAALMAQIEEREAFFKGARVALDVGAMKLNVAELASLRDTLSERGIALWAVVGTSSATESTAQILGLATRLSKPKPDAGRPPTVEAPPKLDDNSAMWVHKTLRSGTRIEYAGHIIVFGDVNPGAEIVAGGSVLVWGRLRGVVHAGAQGNAQAVVGALDLSPTQLRIAGEIAITPARRGKTVPEIVKIVDGRLQAEPWQG